MGLFTRAIDFDTVIAFVDAVKRNDEREADLLGARIWKTKAKSVVPALEGLLFVAEAAQLSEVRLGAEQARAYAHCYKSDSKPVVAAKCELAEALWSAAEPRSAVLAVLERHAHDTALSDADRFDNILSALWSAADVARDRDIGFNFSSK